MVIFMLEPKMLDNKVDRKVCSELEDHIFEGCSLYIVTAFFSMYAYYELRHVFDKVNDVKFIFTSPRFLKEDSIGTQREYEINAVDNNDFFGTDYELRLKNEMNQSFVGHECAKWIENNAEVRSFKKSNTAQPRMIYVNSYDDENICINGTVDFTTDGLGIINSNRKDANTCLYGTMFTTPYKTIFDNIWNDTSNLNDIKDDLLDRLSEIYVENPASFIYYVSLFNIFSDVQDELDESYIIKTGTGFYDTKIWNQLYKFQEDAVIGAIDKIEKHNGCILADSVGLGKTYTALAVIKYYELRNDRVLVLTPKRLRENWTIFTQNSKLNPFLEDRFRYDVLNYTDLNRSRGFSGDINLENINWDNYDLIVIDESHNFRNNPAFKDRKTRYQYLMENVIKSGTKTKVLMLSATPVNNKLTDIKNQINIITEDNDAALRNYNIESINQTLRKSQGIFNKWSQLSEEERTDEAFIDEMDMDYFKLLDLLTIARSRKHIEKYYDITEIGEFPERLNPKNIYSDIDIKEEFPSLSEINYEITHLKLALFNSFDYIYPNKVDEYSEKYDTLVQNGRIFKQKDRDKNIVNLIRINLLKRLESSIHSFKLTLERLLNRINIVLSKMKKNRNYNPDLSILDIDPEDEDFDDELIIGKKNKILFQDIDLIRWKQDLEYDKEKIEQILYDTKKITASRDKKLLDLKNLIKEKLESPINQDNNKILIFTAFADTADYLYKNLYEPLKDYGLNTALITGSGNNKTTVKSIHTTDMNEILSHFSPKSKQYTLKNPEDEIDILIATDCISEGQNLQDCDYLINYDIHWNPVRIIQRFGRIDRIGSENKQIQLVNFWPNIELDEYINLKGRVQNKMILVDISATGEENIIKDKKTQHEMNDLLYRRKQLEQLQKEVLNPEDMDNTISITDVTLNDFKIELMEYMKQHKQKLKQAPQGIYSIIPYSEELEKGVIFLLKTTNREDKYSNPLSPYYLTYVTDNGEVKLNYSQSKKIMDYYKKSSSKTTQIQEKEVSEFNKETKDGKNMEKYTMLLHKAIDDITGKQEEVGVKSLFQKGGTNPLQKDKNSIEQYEIITFLIIK